MNTVEEIVEDIRQGKMVILMDDEDRENEGDLLISASCVSASDINFMARYGRGLICLTLTRERCEQLSLPLMVHNNSATFSTNFTVSIEAAEGVTTGISAEDRAKTVLVAVSKDAKAADLVQPGHIFPLMAQAGGVLTRAGHTEAGCDLAKLAGHEPAAVIVEILKEDGTMARRADLEEFAQQHQIKMGTIADLIEYRSMNERTVDKVGSCVWPTEFGDFKLHWFKDTIDEQIHFALVKGDIKPEQPVLVRVHMANTQSDQLFGIRSGESVWPLKKTLAYVANEGSGVILVLSGRESPESLLVQLEQFAREDRGETAIPINLISGSRTIGVGSQILNDLGVHKMRLMSEEKKYRALSGFNLEVVEYVTEEEK